MRSDAKNLEAIHKAIVQHNGNCPFPLIEIRMNPHEVDRLGWDEILGLPVVGDPKLGTGTFRLVCSGDEVPGEEITEAVTEERTISV